MKSIKPFLFAAAPLAIGCAMLNGPAVFAEEPLTPYEQELVCKFSQACADQSKVDEASVDEGVEVGAEAPFNIFTSARPSAAKPVSGAAATPGKSGAPQLYTPTRGARQVAVTTTTKSYRPAKAKLAAPRRTAGGAVSMDMRVLFGNDSADVDTGSRSELVAWARALNDPKLAGNSIRIEGHTNAVGNRDYNLELSQRRAEAVKSLLVSQGVAASRIEAVGYGFDKPRTANGVDAANRRVEIVKTN